MFITKLLKENRLLQFLHELAVLQRLNERVQRPQRKNAFNYHQLEPRLNFSSTLPSFSPDAGVLYQIRGAGDEQGQLSEIDIANETYVNVGDNTGFKINGTGFRVADGYIYGMKMSTDELIRIGSNGKHEVLGSVSSLPNGNYFTGDFGEDGLLYVRHQANYYGINVDDLVVDRVVTATENVNKTYDIAFLPSTGLHYSIRKSGSRAELISVDLRSGNVADIQVVNDDLRPAGTYGALFADRSGRLFAANNAGGLYEIDVETGVATFAGESPRASSNDGASSTLAYIDLPPIALDSWMSTLAGQPLEKMPIEVPYDLEHQTLEILVTGLPELGQVRHADGLPVELGESLTVDELGDLFFAPPEDNGQQRDAVSFEYQVSDGTHQVSAKMEINFAGRSRITGQVVVMDDTEESAFEGYVFNNEIRMVGVDFLGNSLDQIALTDIHGNFEFAEVAPGNYLIQQEQPRIVFDGYVEIGNSSGVASTNQVLDIVVGEESVHLSGIRFYEQAPASLSGFVYVDSNGNGQVDVDEDGVGRVAMGIVGKDSHGNSVAREVFTDSWGYYEFRGLPSGSFEVSQSQPESYISASINIGEFGGTIEQNAIKDILLSAGQQGLQYNFGEYEQSSIAGSVFIDNDLDNNFDAGDTSVSNSLIRLVGVDFQGNEVFIETATDDFGNYVFENLVAGTYDLVQEQTQGLRDGKSHAGVFNNDETVLTSNGQPGVNRIESIDLGFGRNGRSFNFSKRIDYTFADNFAQVVHFVGTEGDDLIEFTAGSNFHTITINGVAYQVDATATTLISIDGLQGFDRIELTGSESVEQVSLDSSSATMNSGLWKVDAINGEQFIAKSGGGYDRAYLYDTEQDDRLKMTQDYARLWNDQTLLESHGFHRTYAYSDKGGNDKAYLYDSKYDDTVKMTDDNSRMISRKFYNFAGGFERVYAYANNGGNDRAQFWDSPQDNDIFNATETYSRMYNDDFYNFAKGFQQVDAFAIAGGDGDRAYLRGTEGDEVLIASPAQSGLAGNGFRFDAHSFERVYAESEGGNDRAYLFDSKLDDRFVANPDHARLYNNEYYIRATDFSQVDAYSSSGGNDRAYFYDSKGDDTLVTLETEMRLFGDGFDNTGHGFGRSYAHATAGGSDRAFLYDTDQADTIKLGTDVSKMYGDTYYSWLRGFESVNTQFSNANRHDRALVFGAVNESTLGFVGDLAQLIYAHAAEFVYDVESEPANDEYDDPDLTSMFEDLAEILAEKS